MVKNSFTLKRILTTSSALLFASFCNQSVNANTSTTAGNVSLDSNTNWLPNAPVDNDDIIYGGAHRFNANVNNRIIKSIDLNGNVPGAFTIGSTISIGSIGDALAGAGRIDGTFSNDLYTLNLTGTAGGALGANDYSKLSSIDFAGLNSLVKISASNANIPTNFYGNRFGAHGLLGGTIEIDADNVTLSGIFENDTNKRVVNINVNANNTLILDTDLKIYNDLRLTDGGILVIRPGKNLSAHNIKSNPLGAYPEIATLRFEGNHVVDSFIGLGEGNRIGFIEYSNPNSRVEFKKSVNIKYFTINRNSEAVFSDGANFSADGMFINFPGSGVFTFLGDSIVNAQLFGLDSINVNGVGKTVSIAMVDIANNINIADNATVKFLSNVKATDIRGVNPGTANIEFLNQSIHAVIDTDLGLGGKLNNVRISGKGFDFAKTISTNNIIFTNPTQVAALKLSGNGQIGATNITSASTERLHSIWVNSDQDITGNIGTETNPLGTIKLMSDKTLKVNTANFFTDVSNTNNGEGAVEFVKQDSFSYSLGDAASYLSSIKFSESAEVRGSAYSNVITIAPGKTAAFKQRIRITDGSVLSPYIRTVNGIMLEGRDSTVYFGDSSSLYNSISASAGDIYTLSPGEGKVFFAGSVDLKMNIGTSQARLKEIEFAASNLDKVINLSRSMHAENIKFNKANVVVALSGKEIDGNVTFNHTSLDIGKHILVLSGGEAKFTGNPTLKVYFDNVSNSHITIKGQGSIINLSNAENITFNIADNSTLPPKAGRIYNFFRYEDGGALADIDSSKITIIDSNPFVSWTYQNSIFHQTKDVVKGLTTIVKAAGGNVSKIPDALKSVDTDIDSAATRFIGELAGIANTDPARAGEALDKVINATDPSDEVVITNVSNVQTAIFTTRISNNEQFKFRLVEADGISAGEDASARFGAWLNPFYSQSTQKKKRDIIGFKSKAIGGSIGFDTMINDNLVLGIAGTTLSSKVDYKNQRAGDTSKINSYLFSIYGLQSFTNNWFIEGITSAGINKVNNSKVRFVVNGVERALSKYTSYSYGLEFKGGYNYNLTDKAILTPSGGFRYNHFYGDRYKELGTTNQNLSMGKRKFDKLDGVAGLQLAMMLELEKVKLIPQVHSNINYNFSQQSPSTNINLEGLASPMPSRAARPDHSLYNIGTGVVAKIGSIEYELNYDAHLASKYTSHQGSFKVRVNF